MLRVGAKFWHTMRAGWIMEYGNVVAHTAAVLTYRKGPVFHKINTWYELRYFHMLACDNNSPNRWHK
jgi:hypothetical protein